MSGEIDRSLIEKVFSVIEPGRRYAHAVVQDIIIVLAQNNEASALSIPTDETHASLVLDIVAAESDAKRVQKQEHLRNSKFYVIKVVHGDTVIHAIRRTDNRWTTKHTLSIRSFIYEENRISFDYRPRFDLETNIDFFIVADEVLILNKGHFESLLRYKDGYRDDFAVLQNEPEFVATFADLAPLVAHVGTNTLQLRRISETASNPSQAPYIRRLTAS